MQNLPKSKLKESFRKPFITAVCLLMFGHVSAGDSLSDMPAGDYDLDLTHASVIWKVNHLGFSTYPGRFTDFDVDLNLNTADFEKSTVAVDIKVDSIQTAYPNPEKEDFDKVLATEWLKSTEHPSITFNSSSVSTLNGDSFTIDGDLTIAGKTAPVTLNAKLNKAAVKHPFVGKPVIGFSATTTVDRTQWGVSKFAPSLGADVAIEIEGEFVHAGE